MRRLLHIRELSYTHPDGTRALTNISLDLAEGENLVLFGPNGSGKTTLLLHLNGTLAANGEVTIGAIDVIKKNLNEIRRRVGLVFQEADDQLFMPTVLEDVMFGPLNLGWCHEHADREARQTLEAVGIGPELYDKPPFHLSSGEKRRVALAGVLVMRPELLLLDEPTTSLDPPGQRALLELLNKLPQSKIVATHDVSFAEAVSERAVFLENGRIVADGSVRDVASRFGWNPYD
ncbi:MAG TPA: ABC transporter ATP-binding protein [Bryobacteraceae bacterium]|jgi:cobalt/nickel transport system ATP-binding protein|nr:ABC transporter ATP-binding protein [Bryobacteraceae bacterium]